MNKAGIRITKEKDETIWKDHCIRCTCLISLFSPLLPLPLSPTQSTLSLKSLLYKCNIWLKSSPLQIKNNSTYLQTLFLRILVNARLVDDSSSICSVTLCLHIISRRTHRFNSLEKLLHPSISMCFLC